MKNLSIEEKAKRYDETLENMRKFRDALSNHEENDFWVLKKEIVTDIEYYFPELKELDDEMIRKALIDGFTVMKESKNCGKTFSNHKIPVVDILAWLEKQGEQKSQGKSTLEAINEEDVGNANKIDDCSIDSHYFGSIDKAEPKSEIIKDTWYVCTCTTCTEHTRIWFNKGIAYLGNDILKYDLGFEPEEYQSYFRLWTIEDAKDGDVLAEDSCIFIIQRLSGINAAAKTYCTLFDDDDFDSGSTLYFDIDSTKPATKEQRDILFAKMKEAGYEWNKEKKKLIKL